MESLGALITSHALAFQDRHLFTAPEVMEIATFDFHGVWVNQLIESNAPAFKTFVSTAKKADFDYLLAEVFTDKIWTSNRRAFFNVLYKHAKKCEADGVFATRDFGAFYRQRYMTPITFSVERCELRCMKIREELMKTTWHPCRIQKILDIGGQELLDALI